MGVISAFLVLLPLPVYASVPDFQPPEGFQLILSSVGVQLYRKNYANGFPDYVQVIRLDRGAEVRLLHGVVSEANTSPGVFGGIDARFTSLPIQQYWKEIRSKTARAFCVTNGQFFYMYEYPTRLPFPLKVNGRVISGGYSKGEFTDQKLMLEIWQGAADIRPLTKMDFQISSAPNIVGGLLELAKKSPDKYVGRTFIGVDDSDSDGVNETLLIFSTQSARQKDAAEILRQFGAEKVMMLDGGLSTQLYCQGKSYIETERLIPQALAILDGTKPYYRQTYPTPTPGEPGLRKESVDSQEMGNPLQIPSDETDEVKSLPAAAFAPTASPDQTVTPESFNASDVFLIPIPIFLISIFLFGFIYRTRHN